MKQHSNSVLECAWSVRAPLTDGSGIWHEVDWTVRR